MQDHKTEMEGMIYTVGQLFVTLPFSRLLGLSVEYVKADRAGFTFPMKEELIGNSEYGILHGGVISAVLDATGGMASCASAVSRMHAISRDEVERRVYQFGTIDIRIDYLRQGKGTQFHSAAVVIRTGRKVAVTKMELTNQDNVLIAVGTGAYSIGY